MPTTSPLGVISQVYLPDGTPQDVWIVQFPNVEFQVFNDETQAQTYKTSVENMMLAGTLNE